MIYRGKRKGRDGARFLRPHAAFTSTTMSVPFEQGLRQRIPHLKAEQTRPDDDNHAPARDQIVWGQTPSGQGARVPEHAFAYSLTRVTVFRVPTTHDVLTALFHPSYPKSHIDILNLGLLAVQLILFYTLPHTLRKIFFCLYFAFWRAAYDAGLGYVLTKQSKRRWIVRTVHWLGWLDENRRPEVRAWIRRQLVGKMGKDYSFDVRRRSVSIPFAPSAHRVVVGTSARIQHLAALPSGCRYHLDQVSYSQLSLIRIA